MEDVARRASLSKGAVYLYFDSKEALFRALIESRTAPNLERIEEIATAAPSFWLVLDRLAAFGPQMIRASDVPRIMKVLIGDSHTFPLLVQEYRTGVIDRVLSIMTAALKRSADRGEIEIDDADLAARLIVAPFVFSGMWEAVFGKDGSAQVDLEGLFRLHAEFLKSALRKKDGSR
jgi:AcrR family transcriptional regulator